VAARQARATGAIGGWPAVDPDQARRRGQIGGLPRRPAGRRGARPSRPDLLPRCAGDRPRPVADAVLAEERARGEAEGRTGFGRDRIFPARRPLPTTSHCSAGCSPVWRRPPIGGRVRAGYPARCGRWRRSCERDRDLRPPDRLWTARPPSCRPGVGRHPAGLGRARPCSTCRLVRRRRRPSGRLLPGLQSPLQRDHAPGSWPLQLVGGHRTVASSRTGYVRLGHLLRASCSTSGGADPGLAHLKNGSNTARAVVDVRVTRHDARECCASCA
jgi:hypothetical protein